MKIRCEGQDGPRFSIEKGFDIEFYRITRYYIHVLKMYTVVDYGYVKGD